MRLPNLILPLLLCAAASPTAQALNSTQALGDELGIASITFFPTPGERGEQPVAAAQIGGAAVFAGEAFNGLVGEVSPFLLALDGEGTELWSWFGLDSEQIVSDFAASADAAFLGLAGSGDARIVCVRDGLQVWSSSVLPADLPPFTSSTSIQIAVSEDGQRVFALTTTSNQGPRRLLGLDGVDGTMDWVRDAPNQLGFVTLDSDAQGSTVAVSYDAGSGASVEDQVLAYDGASGLQRHAVALPEVSLDSTVRVLCVEPNGNRAYVGGEGEPGTPNDLACVDLATGQVLWNITLEDAIAAIEFDATGQDLLVVSESILSSFGSEPSLHALNPQSGAVQWRTPLPLRRDRDERLTLDLDEQGGGCVVHYDSSPYTDFIGEDKRTTLVAYALSNGAELWRASLLYPAGYDDLSDAVFLSSDRGPLVLSARSAELPGSATSDVLVTAREIDTGAQAWSVVRAFDAGEARTAAVVAAPGSELVFATVFDPLQNRKLVAMDPGSGSVLWSIPAGFDLEEFPNFGPGTTLAATDDGSIVFHQRNATLYDTTHYLTAYVGATGAERWRLEQDEVGLEDSVDLDYGLTPNGGVLAAVHGLKVSNGRVTQMRATSQGGQLLWTATYPDPESTPQTFGWYPAGLELDADHGRAVALLDNYTWWSPSQLVLLVRDLETGALQSSAALDDQAFAPGAALGTPKGYDVELGADGSAAFLVGAFDEAVGEPARVVAARVEPATGATDWVASAVPLAGARYARGESLLSESMGSLVAIAETSSEPETREVVAVGFGIGDGALLWQRTFGGGSDPRRFYDAESSSDGRQVLLGLGRSDGVPEVVALDAATGVELWTAELPNDTAGDLARTLAVREGSAFAWVGSTVSAVDGGARLIELEPKALVSGPEALSVGVPEPLVFAIDRPDASAGSIHLLLGSLTTSSPGLPVDGQFLPLALDGYLLTTLNQAGQGAFAQTVGLLDEAGRARIEIAVPPGLPPALVGTERLHAFLEFDSFSGLATFASEAVAVTLAP